ncbi:MAG: aminopeptidase [Christensenellales bacterium]
MNKQLLIKYAKTVLKAGVNLQKGDDLVISTTVDGMALARELALQAYKAGANRVDLTFSDEVMSRLAYLYQSEKNLTTLPQWYIDRSNDMVDRKACYVAILAEDPDALVGVDEELVAKASRARHVALRRYYDAATNNEIRWCLCAVPSKKWAKKIFPDLPPAKAVDKLWNMIALTMLLDKKDPVEAWEKHNRRLADVSRFLTQKQFCKLRLTTGLGTALEVGMPKGYYFSGGHEISRDGVEFTANMPTEEVFSLPHRLRVNGVVYSSMPLVHNGNTVDCFWLKLENGKIVDFDAKQGLNTLKGIVESDEGSHYLGEIAFVQYDSPIRNLNTLFYNTLFDENASCHLAIGEAYPMIEGAENMDEKTRLEHGINSSCTHVDFMIGTKDMTIVGVDADGNETIIMQNGNFVCI